MSTYCSSSAAPAGSVWYGYGKGSERGVAAAGVASSSTARAGTSFIGSSFSRRRFFRGGQDPTLGPQAVGLPDQIDVRIDEARAGPTVQGAHDVGPHLGARDAATAELGGQRLRRLQDHVRLG